MASKRNKGKRKEKDRVLGDATEELARARPVHRKDRAATGSADFAVVSSVAAARPRRVHLIATAAFTSLFRLFLVRDPATQEVFPNCTTEGHSSPPSSSSFSFPHLVFAFIHLSIYLFNYLFIYLFLSVLNPWFNLIFVCTLPFFLHLSCCFNLYGSSGSHAFIYLFIHLLSVRQFQLYGDSLSVCISPWTTFRTRQLKIIVYASIVTTIA